jgi:hypothetical protein
MQHSEFLKRFVDELRLALPASYQGFATRAMGGLVKLYYGANDRVHYELALRSTGFVEVGLHFEDAKDKNDDLLRRFSDDALEVISQLGPQVEIEQWTKTWGRVHQTIPFSNPDERLLTLAVTRMAAMITVLQPMLEEA